MRLSNGSRVRRAFAAGPGPHPSTVCYLVGTRDDPARADGNLTLSKLFYAPPARFGFSTLERQALEFALLGASDPEMAASLGVSLWTIKKRWQGIYRKVEAVEGPTWAERETDTEEVRHMEEIRPVYAPRTRAARGARHR